MVTLKQNLQTVLTELGVLSEKLPTLVKQSEIL